jgi:hypothetical protein
MIDIRRPHTYAGSEFSDELPIEDNFSRMLLFNISTAPQRPVDAKKDRNFNRLLRFIAM